MPGCTSRLYVALSALLVVVAADLAHGQSTLTWSDEFDGSTLNSDNWEIMIGNGDAYGVPGWGNNEWEYYTGRSENLVVAGGYLHIIAREEDYAGFDYTSARIRSQNRQEFLYGRIEARMKLPQGQGIWPAFWMLPTDSPYGGWASSGEIDIMEAIGVPWSVHGTLHFGGGWPNNTSSGGSYSTGVNFADDFHVYTLEWEEDVMRWFVDGVLFSTKTSDIWWSSAAPSNSRAPFDHPFHLLFNVAVGGNWPGYPDASTVFPQEMLIDWVRVYSDSNASPTITIDAPADGAVLPVGAVTFAATAADTDGTIDRVQFYVNDVLIDEDTTEPYATNWNATDGCHRLRAVALDDLGGLGSDEITVKVGAGCAGDPYLGFAAPIPGVVEVENYDLGGENVAYHDCDGENNGGAYRPDEGVDVEDASGGGYNIGWMCAGEWLNYAVDVTQGGYYQIEARVASQDTGGMFALEFDGVDVTGDVVVNPTGGWQAWTTVTATAHLPAGLQELRFVNRSTTDQYNFDRLTFVRFEDNDYDLDGDVDLTDWVRFAQCLSGTGSSAPQGTCPAEYFMRSDADGDNDVDLFDFAAFQRARTTP